MYLSAKRYPEFFGKDKQYVRAALKYCISKSGHGYRIWFVFAVLLVSLIAWNTWLEPQVLEARSDSGGFFSSLVVGILFWLYLIVDVNTTTRWAVERHIRDFESNVGDT